MKKFIVIILSLLYLTAASGATMHLHYCMGELIDWTLSHSTNNEKCPNCGMNKVSYKGCCKDIHKQLKVDDQNIVDANLFLASLTSVAIAPAFFEPVSAYLPSVTEKHPLTNAPPLVQGVPLFIRNCVFRI